MSNALRHGDARSGRVARLHAIWRGILKRCNPAAKNPNPKYAGRGITVCDEWRDYVTFRAWAQANGYTDLLSIERRDNDGPYCPSNCLWIPMARQAANRRNNHPITHDGRTMCVEDWAREVGIGSSSILYRLRVGWDVARALSTPPMAKPGRPKKQRIAA